MSQSPARNSPRLLWAAPFCLHDTYSGAAMLVKCIMEQLVARGIRCHALAALTSDAPSRTDCFPLFEDALKKKDARWLQVTDKGVKYEYLVTKSRSLNAMTRFEIEKLYSVFLHTLDVFKPDILLLYGASVLETSIIAECKRRGIITVMQIPNENYIKYGFHDIDLVIAESIEVAKYYHAHSRINSMPTGTFIQPEQVLVQKPISPKYITFINPHPTKGVSLFLSLALWAKEKHPDWRFMVVESRGTWSKALSLFLKNAENFPNVYVQEHTSDIRSVYVQTKLLLVPSVCYELFGRVAAEAVMNGIPVLASRTGGLPESVNGGGICLDAPKKCRDDFTYLPQREEMQTWIDALETMLDPEAYPTWQAKAQEASKCHDIEKSTDRLMGYLKPLIEHRRSVHPQSLSR